MESNVKKETELYDGMRTWLNTYLLDKYGDKGCKVITLDCHSSYLDRILEQYDVIKYYPEVVGLQIQIDVLGIVIFNNRAELYFIEAKKTQLNLQNLGQLLIYCKLCNPSEAYLLSSVSLGSISKVLKNLGREDLLEFGDNKKLKRIKIAKWDVIRKTVDHHSIVPQI